MSLSATDPVYDERGLAPAIVQDARTGRVLMLGYVNATALEATRRTGFLHFWSRSRNRLWKKGETSGNVLEVVSLGRDCDGDALLVQVLPAGPTCHTGAVSCFAAEAGRGAATLDRLWETIVARATLRPEGSYTVELLDGGVDACARKVIEEAGEVVLAAKDHAVGGPATRVVEEAADLLYHLLVLLAERDVPFPEVAAELDRRAR